jgi:hypothetical protein
MKEEQKSLLVATNFKVEAKQNCDSNFHVTVNFDVLSRVRELTVTYFIRLQLRLLVFMLAVTFTPYVILLLITLTC